MPAACDRGSSWVGCFSGGGFNFFYYYCTFADSRDLKLGPPAAESPRCRQNQTGFAP